MRNKKAKKKQLRIGMSVSELLRVRLDEVGPEVGRRDRAASGALGPLGGVDGGEGQPGVEVDQPGRQVRRLELEGAAAPGGL